MMKFKFCPFCLKEKTLSKSKVKKTSIKKNKVVNMVFDVWKCSSCNEEFFHNWDKE